MASQDISQRQWSGKGQVFVSVRVDDKSLKESEEIRVQNLTFEQGYNFPKY
jgi:hypothetical protein